MKLILDVETCPIDVELDEVRATNMFCYDIGFIVCDDDFNIVEKHSLTIHDIFCEEKYLMNSAYYSDKIPTYWNDIKAKEKRLVRFKTAQRMIADICRKYNIKEMWAYNAYFDYTALNRTQRWLTKSKYKYFLPYGVETYDILKATRQVISKDPDYINFCHEHDYLTARKQVQLKAETVYRYLTNDTDFEEEHQGLDDCMIEMAILKYCLEKNKNVNCKLWA